MRTAVKSFGENPSVENLSEAFSRIDRAVKRNLIHRNTAARRKARLAKLLAAQSGSSAKSAKATKSAK